MTDTLPPAVRTTPEGKSVRFRTDEDYEQLTPVHVVWEVTLACNLSASTADRGPAGRVPTS